MAQAKVPRPPVSSTETQVGNRVRTASSASSSSSAATASTTATSNDDNASNIGSHPVLADAPKASFSVATKPQDREPNRLAQAGEAHDNPQQPLAYQLDQNGRLPANDFNYLQRDRLVAEAQSSAVKSGHDHWVRLLQLSYLASQHHLSPYSTIKFGPRGSPFAYIPVTLQQPHLVEETMQRQRQHEKKAINWLLTKRQNSLTRTPIPTLRVASIDTEKSVEQATSMPLAGSKRPASITAMESRVKPLFRATSDAADQQLVERQLSEAMSLSIDDRPHVRPPLSRSSSSSSTTDDTTSKVNATQRSPRSTSHQASDSELKTDDQAGSTIKVGGPLSVDNIMSQEMEEAITVEQSAHPKDAQIPNDVSHTGALPAQDQRYLATKTSDTHPIHISPILPAYLLKHISLHINSDGIQQDIGPDGQDPSRQDVQTYSYMDMASHAEAQVQGRRLIRLPNTLDLAAITRTHPNANYLTQAQLAEQEAQEAATDNTQDGVDAPGSVIGNLLLSSCPGKKVRLSGPVRGRGAICRDLGLDLKRIHAIGVRAVVCCLDDDELAYLGAPWQDYEREADALGLEVIRLPMAEGFAPTDVREMDTAITALVTDFTLRGIDVLVHCRGGVGRAGLIACAWMLKMGFVGTATQITANQNPALIDSGAKAYSVVGQETARGKELGYDLENIMSNDPEADQIIDTVRSLIETIRRRRSPKAIETAEQVRFLVELVAFLRRQEQLRVRTLFPQQNIS